LLAAASGAATAGLINTLAAISAKDAVAATLPIGPLRCVLVFELLVFIMLPP
jgi:hypothetical protein